MPEVSGHAGQAGPGAAAWSGMAYMLIWPLQALNGRIMRPRIRAQLDTAAPQSPPPA